MPYFPPPTEKSRLLEGPERIRTSTCLENDQLIDRPNEKISTFYDLVVHGKEQARGGPCLGHKPSAQNPYVWMNYDEVFDSALALASGLHQLGFEAGNNTMIGIYGINSPEWMLTHIACVANSMISVPLYHTFDPQSLQHILAQTGLQIAFCDTEHRLLALLELCDCPRSQTDKRVQTDKNEIRYFVLMKRGAEMSDSVKNRLDSHVKVLTFDELIRIGREKRYQFKTPTPDDVCLICYTSGTTGNAKGVILTHRNVVSGVAALTRHFDVSVKPNPTDCLISYLPLAHIYEQVIEACVFYYGGRVGYYSGDILKLMDDAQSLQPTIFPLVPRLINRLVNQVQKKISESSRISRAIFYLALNRKMAAIERGEWGNDSMWDWAFQKIHAILGGRVRFATLGSAPVSPEILKFARAVFGAVLLEGYGQTEFTGAATATLAGDATVGHVGVPTSNAQIKLVDVPELGYFAANDQGEICIRGSGVMKGYYKDPEKTAETMDSDGWLHTGDVGCWTEDGCLKIIDRRKHIFKLAQGEYVAPEKIENILSKCPLISQIYVDGDSLESYLVAVVVPDETTIRKWLQTQPSLDSSSPKDVDFANLCKNDSVAAYVLSVMREIGKQGGLSGLEEIKSIYLCSELFSPENGLLTPTMKNKRPQLRKRFAQVIKDLYRDKKIVNGH